MECERCRQPMTRPLPEPVQPDPTDTPSYYRFDGQGWEMPGLR